MSYILYTTAEVLARSAVSDNIFGPWKELGNPFSANARFKEFFTG